VSEYEIIRTRRPFTIGALNYLKVSSTDTDLVGSKESLSNGGDRSRGINEADTASFARSYGDCFLRLSFGLVATAVTSSPLILRSNTVRRPTGPVPRTSALWGFQIILS